jgi:hypothetical protein
MAYSNKKVDLSDIHDVVLVHWLEIDEEKAVEEIADLLGHGGSIFIKEKVHEHSITYDLSTITGNLWNKDERSLDLAVSALAYGESGYQALVKRFEDCAKEVAQEACLDIINAANRGFIGSIYVYQPYEVKEAA